MRLTCKNIIAWNVLVAALGFQQLSLAEIRVGAEGETVQDLAEPALTANVLAGKLLGNNVSMLHVRHAGTEDQAGFVSGYGSIVGIENGVVLSTGKVSSLLGPNTENESSDVIFDINIEDRDFFLLNDQHFTRDESILKLDFIPPADQTQITFRYVFGSDEYPAGAPGLHDGMQDFMAVFVNGVNCAQIGGSKVGVDTLNANVNSESYIDNTPILDDPLSTLVSPYNTQMDGFSRVLTCTAPVLPGQENHLEIGIVDSSRNPSKSRVNSWVIIESKTGPLGDNDGGSDDCADNTDCTGGNDDDAGNQDSDGDGVSDRDECPVEAACPDSDGDGIPDYLDNVDNTDPRAVGGNGSGADERVKVGLNGAGALGGEIFVLLAVLGLARCWRARRSNKSFFQLAISCVVVALGLTVLSRPISADEATPSGAWYVLGALGPSSLQPDTNGTAYQLDDDQDLGYKLALGYDLFDQLSVEASLAKLGSATLLPTGKVQYDPYAVSALYHVLGQRGEHSVFIKAGLATLNTSSNVPTDTVNNYQLLLGFGGEWAWRHGWSLRAELESYDKDASHLSVGVVKRFVHETTQPKAEIPAETAAIQKPLCTDAKPNQTCYMPPIVEQKKSCALVAGRVENFYFDTNRAELAQKAELVLNEIAEALKTCPAFNVEIRAHADSVGTNEKNLVLSRLRAQTVRLYLETRGVASSRLTSEGYGESRPIADNRTAEGRALNRRVEFEIKQANPVQKSQF